MNIQYLRYAVEIANCGSISKASEKLYVAQPNLSRAIKELEKELNVTVFERTPQGIRVTTDGERLIKYGKTILRNIDEMESMFKTGNAEKSVFSLSAPRAGYISAAFAEFAKTLSSAEFEVYYKETNALRSINNIVHADYKLGIVRYNSRYDKYFKDMLEQKELSYELVTEFTPVLLVSKDSPLVGRNDLTVNDLSDFVEIANPDPFVPSLPMSDVRKNELSPTPRRIFVFERASQLELLSSNSDTFVWTSKEPAGVLEKYGLEQIEVADCGRNYKDLLIYSKDYKLTSTDRRFVTELCLARRKIF